MNMRLYRVTGKREYRGHKPGAEFVARLDPGPEQRAIYRGDITVLEEITPGLEPGSYRLPRGWLRPSPHPVNRGAERRLFHGKE